MASVPTPTPTPEPVAVTPVLADDETPTAPPSGRPLAESGDSFQTAFAEQPDEEPVPVVIAPEPVAGFVVQAAAFSTPDRAERAADALGGKVTPAGKYYRVRTGPFVTRSEAEASLAKVRAAGYTDARILTSG